MLTTVERVMMLKRVILFERLTTDQLKVVAKIAREEEREENQVIFTEGEPGDRLYIVISGRVALANRQENIKFQMKKNDFFGEMSLFDEDRSLSARTVETTSFLVIRKQEFENLLHRYPHIAIGVIRAMSRRLREANRELSRE